MTAISVTVVRTTPTARDRYGDAQPGTEERFTLSGVFFAPRVVGTVAVAEMQDRGREGIMRSATLYAPVEVDVLRTDRLEVMGELWEVEGDPAPWISPLTGRQGGKEIAIRRVEG